MSFALLLVAMFAWLFLALLGVSEKRILVVCAGSLGALTSVGWMVHGVTVLVAAWQVAIVLPVCLSALYSARLHQRLSAWRL